MNTDARIKGLRLIVFPLILPIVKGRTISEGPIDDQEVVDDISSVHEIYKNWITFKSRTFVIKEDFLSGTGSCPIPKNHDNMIFFDTTLPMTFLLKTNRNTTYKLLKEDIDRHRNQVLVHQDQKSTRTIPHEVVLQEHKTIITTTTGQESKTIEKNERFISFLSILFSRG